MESDMPDNLPPNGPVHDAASADAFERALTNNGWTPEDAKARADQFRANASPTDLPSKSAAPFRADGTGVSPDQVEKAVEGQLAYRGQLAVKLNDQSLSASERALAETSLKQVDEFLRKAGRDPVNPPVDTRTGAERSFDDAGLNVTTDVNAYDLRGVFSRPDLASADIASLDRTMRSAMVELGIPPSFGRFVAESVLDGQRDWSRLRTDQDRIEHHLNHQRIVSRALGVSYDKVTATLAPIIAKMSEGNKQWLAQSGAFESAAVLVHLYRASQLPAERAKRHGNG
jgi:hypothetical protein